MDIINPLVSDGSGRTLDNIKIAVVGAWTEHIVHVISYFVRQGINLANIGTSFELVATGSGDDAGSRSHLTRFLKIQEKPSLKSLIEWLHPTVGDIDLPRLHPLSAMPDLRFNEAANEGQHNRPSFKARLYVEDLFRRFEQGVCAMLDLCRPVL